MTKYFSILIFLTSLIFSNAKAQYGEFYLFDNVPMYIINTFATAKLMLNDAEVLKGNKVMEVRVKNDSGKIITKMLINKFGYVEEYINYNPVEDRFTSQWRLGYDVNNNLTAVSKKEGRNRQNYILTYDNNRLASIHIDSLGIESQYDFARDSTGKLFKITLLDLVRDTVKEKYLLEYNSDGKITNLRDENKSNLQIDISYSESGFIVTTKDNSIITYKISNGRIQEKTYTLLNQNPGDYTENTKYFYSDNGLISEVQKTMDNIYIEYKYEYVFYTQ